MCEKIEGNRVGRTGLRSLKRAHPKTLKFWLSRLPQNMIMVRKYLIKLLLIIYSLICLLILYIWNLFIWWSCLFSPSQTLCRDLRTISFFGCYLWIFWVCILWWANLQLSLFSTLFSSVPGFLYQPFPEYIQNADFHGYWKFKELWKFPKLLENWGLFSPINTI